MADLDIYNLELLSLVNKITQELDNHTGYNDKTLAEFILSLHDESKTLPEFKQKLKDVGAGFPDAFVENIDRLILSLHPKHKKKASKAAKKKGKQAEVVLDETDKRKRMFPGLALKDHEYESSSAEKDVIMQEVDNMMAQFESTAKKPRARAANDERSPKRQRREHSQSPPRRRSPSPPRGRGGYGGHEDRHDGGRSGFDSRDGGRGRHNDRGRPQLDEKPVMYKIYNGRVQSLKDFGAFVQLEGIAGPGRAEGAWSSLRLPSPGFTASQA